MLKILSIDDSRSVHAFLGSLFDPSKSSLAHAYNGLEGIQLLEAKPAPELDLILLDWEMPKLTGIETLERIRAIGIQTPVIMLTSKNDPAEIERALTLGANEYVMKPFTKDILYAKIESVLGREIA